MPVAIMLRIQVAMAFGRMHTKFRLWRSKKECELEQQSKLLGAISRLYNFIIWNEGWEQPAKVDSNNDGQVEGELEANDTEPMTNGPNGSIAFDFERGNTAPSSSRRDAIVMDLAFNEIRQPAADKNG